MFRIDKSVSRKEDNSKLPNYLKLDVSNTAKVSNAIPNTRTEADAVEKISICMLENISSSTNVEDNWNYLSKKYYEGFDL